MMIVIPMFIQTTTFGFILKHFLHNNSGNAIAFAGVFLLIAATLTLLIKAGKPSEETTVHFSGGH
jgi:maltose/moltooligosaccharide transporter